MTVPFLNQDALVQLIKDNGWQLSTSTYWEEYNRLVFEKDGSVYVFQCKERGIYMYMEVVELCQILGINAPEDHLHSYYRHLRMDEEVCYCKDGKQGQIKFKDCHGKKD